MKAVFLDIDGVLQPYDTKDRFYEIDKKAKKLVQDLSEKYHVDYSRYSIYDILMVYYDWKSEAVERLRSVLNQTGAKIIISSDWRRKEQPNKMLDLLRIHELDKYWFADNIIIKKPIMAFEQRYEEITDSLNRYPIDNFVVLDDMEQLKEYFPNNSVITNDYITVSDMNECVRILKKVR